MTNREFYQAKFGLILLSSIAVFFTFVALFLLQLGAWYPARVELFSGMADWFLKAAIGPTVGALISSIITPHNDKRREDSEEFVPKPKELP